MSAKERISHQQRETEDEHLHGQQTKRRRSDGEDRTLANVAGDLRELDARELNLLPR